MRKAEPSPATAAAKFGRGLLWALLVYSLVHFAVSGVWSALAVRGGDVLSAFPGPLVPGREQFGADTVAVQYPNPTWNYGPVTQFWTYPLGFTRSVPQAMLILLLLNYALLGAAFVIWLGELRRGRDMTTTLLIMLVVWLNYFPLLQAIVGREIELLEFFLLSVAFCLLRRGRDAGAGALIGIATMTKFLPGLFIPYLCLKARWRAVSASIAAIVVIAAAGQWLLGFEHSVTLGLLREWSSSPVVEVHADNQALINVVQRVINTGVDPSRAKTTSAFPRSTKVVGNILQVAIAGAVFLALWRRRALPIGVWEYSLLLITMIVIPPWNNLYYLSFLVIPFSVAFVVALERPARFSQPFPALFVAYALSGYLVPLGILGRIFSLPPISLRNLLGHLSLPGIGMLILFGVFWALDRSSPDAARGSAPQSVSPASTRAGGA